MYFKLDIILVKKKKCIIRVIFSGLGDVLAIHKKNMYLKMCLQAHI